MFGYIVFMVLAGYGLYIIANVIGYQDGRGRALKYGQPIPKFAGNFVIFEGIVISIMCINSAINPIIYHWKSEAFRSAFKKILSCSDSSQNKIESTNLSDIQTSPEVINTVSTDVA